jgi:hypothetical protein
MVAVTITSSVRPLRRSLGPTAWAVLEDMLCDGESAADGSLVCRTNVRQLAANLGLSKDTVARAVSRLCDTGMVQHDQRPRGEAGRFGRREYRIATAPLATLLAAAPSQPCAATPRRRPRANVPAQGALFDSGDT